MRYVNRFLCWLGFHGPILRSGYPCGSRNHSVSPGIRGCRHCESKWFADAEDMGGYWRLIWRRL